MEPNEVVDKPKFNWKRLLITVGIVIVTAGAIGGSVYYVMNQQAQKDKENAEKTAQDLQKQIDDLKKTETATSTTTTTPTTTTTTDPTASWKTYTDTTYNFSFKYPTGLAVTPSKSNNTVNYYMLSINKNGVIDSNGINTDPDSSSGYISVSTNSSGGTPTSIAGLTANYSTATTPMGYTYYAYEFTKGGKNYLFRMNNYNDGKFVTLDQFKTMVGTFKFN